MRHYVTLGAISQDTIQLSATWIEDYKDRKKNNVYQTDENYYIALF